MPLHVGILPHADLPHIVPCFRIGRELLKAGHDVSVLGSDVQKIGRGHSESWDGQLAAFGLTDRQIVHRRSSQTISDWLVQQSKDLQLDVVILDAVWQGLAYGWQDSSSTRVVVHHAGLPDFRSSDMPTWYFVHPGHSIEQWASARRANEQCEQAGQGVRGLFSSMKALSSAGRKTRDVYGLGCGELEALPAIRAMSLCPAAEFPDERGRVVYLGTLLPKADDIDWKPLPSEVTDPSRSIIACVFGTTGLRTREEYEWLLSLAKKLARHFVDCQVLAVVPKRMRGSNARDYPGNLLVYPWIPLWELLSTRLGSKVLVAPPGVGAFREATASGAPIVAIPRRLDQFGAAARVEYFGTGSALVSDDLPPHELVVKRVAHALDDSNVRLNAERLHREFIAFDATRPLIRFMDTLTRG